MQTKQLGYYAIDKDKNLFQFEWSSNNDFSILKNGTYSKVDVKDYKILEIAHYEADGCVEPKKIDTEWEYLGDVLIGKNEIESQLYFHEGFQQFKTYVPNSTETKFYKLTKSLEEIESDSTTRFEVLNYSLSKFNSDDRVSLKDVFLYGKFITDPYTLK